MRRTTRNNVAQVAIDPIVLKGGLDQVTPTLSLKNGYARQSVNYECATTGGYSRVAGYERFDGQISPTDKSTSVTMVGIGFNGGIAPSIGSKVTTPGGFGGTVLDVKSWYRQYSIFVIATVDAGTPLVGEVLTVTGGSVVGSIFGLESDYSTPLEDATLRASYADILRQPISAVPGSGPIRGVFEFEDFVYAFRDNEDADHLGFYYSSSEGWKPVSFYQSIYFTNGGPNLITEISTSLVQGTVSSVIKRVLKTSGSWSDSTAQGRLILVPNEDDYVAGTATAGSTTVTLSGAQTTISLLPGGRVETEEHNFYGQSRTNKVYGCDGINNAWEFDGSSLIPIMTGATVDTPTHVVAHQGYLFLSIGSLLYYSEPGLPFNWSATNFAGVFPVGCDITGLISMPGGTASATLGVLGRNNTFILYGKGESDWNLISYNTGTGTIPYSLLNMAQTFAFDDRGVNSIQTSLQYGNFSQSTLTSSVLPFINSHVNMLTAATLCRRKSQYRAFFSDGYALYMTVVNGKLMGSMPVYMPNPVTCCYEGKTSTGHDVMYFGSTNGMVYQLDKGTSFDGESIESHLVLNYSTANSPRTLKRYRRASLELIAEESTFAVFDFSFILGYDSIEYSQIESNYFGRYLGQLRWDSFTWDNFYWDTKGITPVECGLEGTAENIALVISGVSNIVKPFTINSVLIHYSPRRVMR